ncbi:MAG TPA: hypothetical protein DCX07_12210 [Phycisphaerales bacterium]|nr:hypothetical protein [Phycisphaerales bacterium]
MSNVHQGSTPEASPPSAQAEAAPARTAAPSPSPGGAGVGIPHAQRIPPTLWRLFGWLLWGDFVLVLMEQVVPTLVPLLLKEHQLSNTAISLIMGTIPAIFGLFIMPIISYRSDQLRTRWGRRIPFMVVTAPLIVMSLCLIPLSPRIAQWLEQVGWLRLALEGIGLNGATLVFAVTIASYMFFNAVCSACYAYLMPDVVPGQFMGRFMSLFRVFGLAGLFVFSFFFMRLAEKHMTGVFFGVAAVYGLGFLVVCWKVKEPEYPPPTDQRTVNPIAVFASYARHCFRHPMYLWMYGAFAMYGISQVAGNLFDVLFMRETLGMDMATLGQVRAWTAIAVLPLAYFCGNLVDRWKSQRMIIVCALLLSVGKICGYLFITGPGTYVVWTIVYNVVAFFWGVTNAAFIVNMFPRDRYGQFVSCNVFISAVVVLIVTPLCGLFFDWMDDYRYVYLWPSVLTLGVVLLMWKVNRHWHRCGGPDNYQAP